MTKKIYKLSGMHCTSCAMVIEGELEDNLGVRAVCDWIKHIVEVEGEVDDKSVRQVIEGQGYKVVGIG